MSFNFVERESLKEKKGDSKTAKTISRGRKILKIKRFTKENSVYLKKMIFLKLSGAQLKGF